MAQSAVIAEQGPVYAWSTLCALLHMLQLVTTVKDDCISQAAPLRNATEDQGAA